MNKKDNIRRIDNKVIITSELDLYHKYIRSINGVLNNPISEKEADILFIIYKSNGELTTELRKTICSVLKITDKNLNNFISRMTKAKSLVKKDGKITVPLHLSLPSTIKDGDMFIVVSRFRYKW